MSDEKYVKVKAVLIYAPQDRDAIYFEFGYQSPEDSQLEWIPKSLIHGGDLLKLTNELQTELVEFRMMEWKARKLGLD